jgi:hypothetical protein
MSQINSYKSEGPIVDPKTLPCNQAKVNLLKQINDAASQLGGQSTTSKMKLNNERNAESKRTA